MIHDDDALYLFLHKQEAAHRYLPIWVHMSRGNVDSCRSRHLHTRCEDASMDLSRLHAKPAYCDALCRKRRGVLFCHHPRVANPLPHQELRAVYQLLPPQLMAPSCWWLGVKSLDQRRLRCSTAQRAGFSTRLYSLPSRARSGCLPL
jgi:hypothetical protein